MRCTRQCVPPLFVFWRRRDVSGQSHGLAPAFVPVTLIRSRKPRKLSPRSSASTRLTFPRGPHRLAGLVPAWPRGAVPRPPTAPPSSHGFHHASSSFLDTVPGTVRSPHGDQYVHMCAFSDQERATTCRLALAVRSGGGAGLHLQFVSVVLHTNATSRCSRPSAPHKEARTAWCPSGHSTLDSVERFHQTAGSARFPSLRLSGIRRFLLRQP